MKAKVWKQKCEIESVKVKVWKWKCESECVKVKVWKQKCQATRVDIYVEQLSAISFPTKSLLLLLQKAKSNQMIFDKYHIPGEKHVDPYVGGDNDDERQEEDLGVVHHVVDVRPVVWADKKHWNFFKYKKKLLFLLF